jgi:hypothetical protein
MELTLARYVHDLWRRHVDYVFSQGKEEAGGLVLKASKVESWKRQMAQDFEKGNDAQKASGIVEARRILDALQLR